jgi:peptidoglycan/LPS O-acetylase OafA/YrhL
VLNRYKGNGPGFDVLRILLALVIFAGHARWASGLAGMAIDQVANKARLTAHHTVATTVGGVLHVSAWTGPGRPIKLALVPMFFALSGFLVAGSAVRLRRTGTFLTHRALRIFPALVVEVVLSALLLGIFFTTLPLASYFADPQFSEYLLNAVGDISYTLPGVFVSNPVHFIVNVNLWTLPSEFYCYLAMAALMLTGLVYNRPLYTGLMVVATLALAVAHAMSGISTPLGPFPAHVVVYYFLFGVLFFHWRDRIPASPWLFAASAVASYVLLMFDSMVYLAPLPVAYMTLYVGLIPMPKSRLLSSGDYSYGIYLYGFPITQSLIALRPQWFTGGTAQYAALLCAAIVLTTLFAAASWHLVEKRALALKKRLPARWMQPATMPSEEQQR